MLIEICIDTIDSALAAENGGAHRIEVCGSLSSGGVTPSIGLIQQCVEQCGIPSMVMIRPHDGGFQYTKDEIDTMSRDILAAKRLGVQGVVFGVLNQENCVDTQAMERLIDTARPLEVTFHRAFDVVASPFAALDALVLLRVDRLLTSGQAITAESGTELIKQIVDRADEKMSVMAGAGISSANARGIVATTGVQELHASASVPRYDLRTQTSVRFGDQSQMTSAQRVRDLVAAVT